MSPLFGDNHLRDTATDCSPFAILKSTLENPAFSAREKVSRLLGLRRETMSDLAAVVGCNRVTLYKAFTGKTELKGWDPGPVRERVAEYLGVASSVLWPEQDAIVAQPEGEGNLSMGAED